MPALRSSRQPQGPASLDLGHPLARGLVFSTLNTAGVWPRNDVDGRMATGVPAGFVADTSGLSPRFNGTTHGHVHALNLSGQTKMTLAVSFRASAWGSDRPLMFIMAPGAYADGNVGFGIVPGSASGAGGFLIFRGNGGYCIHRHTRPSLDAWHTLVVRINPNAANSYPNAWLDGVAWSPSLENNNGGGTANYGSTYQVYIGNHVSAYGAFDIRSVQIWARWLEDAEAKQYTNNPWAFVQPVGQRAWRVEFAQPVNPLTGVPMPVLPRFRHAQQPMSARIDHGHPLARGLVLAAYHTHQETMGPPSNAMRGTPGSHVYGTTSLYTSPKGSSRYWSSAGSKVAAPIEGATKLTLAFDLYWPSFANDDALCFSSENWTTGGTLLIDPNAGNGNWAFEYRHTNTARCIAYFTRPSAGWHSYVLTFDVSLTANQAAGAWVDGVAQSIAYFSNSIGAGGTFRDLNLTFMHHDGPSLQGTGSLRNVKIYTRLLNGAEALALARNPWQMFVPDQRRIAGKMGQRTIAALPPRGVAMRRQPYQRPELMRGHPMAVGLLCSALNAVVDNTSPINYVTRQIGSALSSQAPFVTSRGVAFASAGGTTDYLDIPVDCSLHQRITISFLLWIDSYGGSTNVIDLGDILGNGTLAGVYLNPDSGTGRMLFSVYSQSNLGRGQEITRPSAGAWHHYAVVIDLTQASQKIVAIYVDKVLQSLTTNDGGSGGSTFSPKGMRIWQYRSLGGYNGRGKMLNLNIHARLLSAQEVACIADDPYQIFSRPGVTIATVTLTANVGGPYRISGIITAATIPLLGAIVRLYLESTGALLRTTTTAVDGSYTFGGVGDELTAGVAHTVIAYDALTGYQYNGGILRGLIPGNGPLSS